MELIYWFLFWVSLGLLYIQWRFLWVPLILDDSRNRLFFLRDRLFDYYLTNNLDFNSIEYGKMRDLMNSVLRFGHRISIFEILYVNFCVKNFKEISLKEQKKIKNTIEGIKDDKLKSFHEELYFQYNFEIVRYFILSSPFLIIAFLGLFIFFLVHHQMKQALKFTVSYLSKEIESQIEYSDHIIGKAI